MGNYMEEIFQEIYFNLKKECSTKLGETKNKKRKYIISIFAVLLIINLGLWFFIESKTIMPLSIMLSITLWVFFIFYGNRLYRETYKDEVIRNLISLYNKKMYYDPKYGIPRSVYLSSNFDKSFNTYNSEDRFFGKFEDGSNFQMSEVVAEYVNTYTSNGRTYTDRYETFAGLFGVIKLSRNLLEQIDVYNDSHTRKYDKDRIEVDSAEFEEYYDLLARDKILALKIFTPELIEKFNELRRENPKCVFESKLNNEYLYFRFKCGHNLFEPSVIKSDLDEKMLKRYFKLIYYPIELSKKIVDNINNIKQD